MAHDDDEPRPRGPRGRPRGRAPTSVAEMYAQQQPAPDPPRSSKMKMASLMGDDRSPEPSGSKRVKTGSDWGAPMRISSLTTDAASPGASSMFQEMPAVVQSFANERRRDVVTQDAKNGVANGDSTPPAKSVFDFYFPGARTERDANGSRSLKRKRRGGRRHEDGGVSELDLLRFGVDAAKLVPQGLVDRVDVQMSRAALLKIVGNHVNNWCNRSGFAPSFLQELMTLLAAYYPCTYPTLLDEVLAGFLFKRPEFMEVLLPPMLEKMVKTGESVTTNKYPVVEAFVRIFGALPSRTPPQEVTRHELACRMLLRCLLEPNREKFVLSPWISACAAQSSDNVLHCLWRVLLPYRSPIQDGKDATTYDLNWQVEDPTQQIVELLAEEGKQRACRFSCGFVELLLSDEHLKKHLVDSQSFLIPDCFEQAFAHASSSWSASLLSEWIQRCRKQKPANADVAEAFKELVAFLVRFTSKISTKKSHWFSKHILSFVLSPQCYEAEREPALRVILQDYMTNVLGGAPVQSTEKNIKQNGVNGSTTDPLWDDLDTVGSQAVLDAKSKLEALLILLGSVSSRSSVLFVDIWSDVWSDEVTIPWAFIHGLLVTITQNPAEGDTQHEFNQKLQRLTARLCGLYFRRLGRETHNDTGVKFSEALNLLLPSAHPLAEGFLHEVVGGLAEFDKKNSTAADAVLSSAITLLLGSDGDDGLDTSSRRSVVQKPLVEYDRLAESPTAFAQIVGAIKLLAAKKGDIGDFVRRVLSSRPVARLIVDLLSSGRRRHRQEMLLDAMNAVVTYNSPTRNKDWTRQHVVQDIVHCAYTGPPTIGKKAICLLQNMFRFSSNNVKALLWVILLQCTDLCCGREHKDQHFNTILVGDNFQGKADSFAELVKTMVVAVPMSIVREVLAFVEQKLASCSIGETRMNVFLLLLLRKLVACEIQSDALLPVVQLAVCPLAPSDVDQVRLVQLQLLKALCSRLVAIKHRPSGLDNRHPRPDAEWKRWRDLVCSERLLSDLQSVAKVTSHINIGVDQTSRVSEVLARDILAFVQQLKQQRSLIDEEDEAQRLLKRGRRK